MKITTRKGLWVSPSFTKRFGSDDVEPAKTVPSFKTLPWAMTDAEIKQELGVGECTLADVTAFLEHPLEGCDDGYANLFYLPDCVVYVRWGHGPREWYVRAWELGDDRWFRGYRAFSSNCPSEPVSSGTVPLESLAARIAAIEKVLVYYNLKGEPP